MKSAYRKRCPAISTQLSAFSHKLLTALVILFFLLASYASAEITLQEKHEIEQQVLVITNALDDGQISTILEMISPNAAEELSHEIQLYASGSMIDFKETILSCEELPTGHVKVTGRFSAEGAGWSTSCLTNYFIFEY